MDIRDVGRVKGWTTVREALWIASPIGGAVWMAAGCRSATGSDTRVVEVV